MTKSVLLPAPMVAMGCIAMQATGARHGLYREAYVRVELLGGNLGISFRWFGDLPRRGCCTMPLHWQTCVGTHDGAQACQRHPGDAKSLLTDSKRYCRGCWRPERRAARLRANGANKNTLLVGERGGVSWSSLGLYFTGVSMRTRSKLVHRGIQEQKRRLQKHHAVRSVMSPTDMSDVAGPKKH